MLPKISIAHSLIDPGHSFIKETKCLFVWNTSLRNNYQCCPHCSAIFTQSQCYKAVKMIKKWSSYGARASPASNAHGATLSWQAVSTVRGRPQVICYPVLHPCSEPRFLQNGHVSYLASVFFLGVLCVIRSIPGTLQTCQLIFSLCQHTNYISGLLFVVCLGTLARTRVHLGQTHYSTWDTFIYFPDDPF